MAIAAKVPRWMAERKPPHGSPCNRCGACCYATLCALGRHVFKKAVGPCPALIMPKEPGGESACGLTTATEPWGEAATYLVGTGTGCDARFNSEPINHAFYDTLRQWDRDNAEKIADAEKTWGIKLVEDLPF